jgi:hypothetical protein
MIYAATSHAADMFPYPKNREPTSQEREPDPREAAKPVAVRIALSPRTREA